MIDTHGLKMVGLKNAAHETKDVTPYNGWRVQISYNVRTGEVITWSHYGINDSWKVYHDEDIRTMCHTDHPMTMQEIADEIYQGMEEMKWSI